MKKMICGVIAVMLVCSLAFAETAQAKKFDGNSWLALSKRDRASAVTNYIAAAKQKGITIKKTPIHYAKMIDQYYIKESARTESVEKVLKTLVIMEYDWTESGKSKDQLAKEWLGDDVYKKNKERLAKQK